MEDNIGDRIKGKGGAELFRELLRQYPLVAVEDYYKNGVWQNDLMRLDVQILAAHRLEAGAPDPLPLSQVKMPEVPAAPKALQSLLGAGVLRPVLPGSMRSMMAGATARPAGALTSPALATAAATGAAALATAAGGALPAQAAQAAALPKAVGPVPPPHDKAAGLKRGFAGTSPMPAKVARSTPLGSLQAKSPAVATPPAVAMPPGSTDVEDLRQTALFISKWRLEPTRTKLLLAQLAPSRRRFIMQNFKDNAGVNGTEPIAKLEEYVLQCDKSSAWPASEDGIAAIAATAPTSGALRFSGERHLVQPLGRAPLLQFASPI